MNKIVLVVVLLATQVLTLKAQSPDYYPNNVKPVPFIGVTNHPYFKEYLKIARKNKEDKKFIRFYNRKLIVVLAEEDPEKLKYYKSSPEKLAFYKELVRRNNDLLINLVPDYWRQLYGREKNADTILFKKYSECLELSATKSQEYFTIEFTSLRNSDNARLFELAEKDKTMDFRKELLREEKEYGTFEVKVLEDFRKPALYSFLTITSFPNELDYIIAIQQMGNFFLERFRFLNRPEVFEEESVARAEELSGKILLADSFQVERRNDGFVYIKELYPASYKLTDYNGILEAIKSKDTSYAYIVSVPVFSILGDNSFEYTSGGLQDGEEASSSYYHLLVNARNSEVLMFMRNEPRILNKKSWQRYAQELGLEN